MKNNIEIMDKNINIGTKYRDIGKNTYSGKIGIVIEIVIEIMKK